MEEQFRQKMYQRLINMRAQILENILAENADFMDATSNDSVKDSVDLASNDIDIRLLETIGAQDVNRLKKVEATIGRINNDRFGLCVKCTKKIDEERLEAIPYAALCIDCQKGSEHR
ncbi:TraR/DksA family transcriptional regulator [Candidatus Haliotispira prima]|uniref:TraR/DksA family transcriptional regulator n=1 Tax=Candidatus Haliotispira prima TaxID=3034016 RepID=A0ABY8MIP1_9SPIO|nr:TraR/DksA family transcriptional regulator [Candidatus Haliotispira prima]